MDKNITISPLVAQINETTKVNKFFEEAYERYYTAPTEGVSSSTIQFNLQLQHQNWHQGMFLFNNLVQLAIAMLLFT